MVTVQIVFDVEITAKTMETFQTHFFPQELQKSFQMFRQSVIGKEIVFFFLIWSLINQSNFTILSFFI